MFMDEDKSPKETHELHEIKLILRVCRDRQGVNWTMFLKHKKGQCTFRNLESAEWCINVWTKCASMQIIFSSVILQPA